MHAALDIFRALGDPTRLRIIHLLRAMELAVSKARAHGVGWVVCKGSNHFGAAGYWAEQAAREHLLAFSFTNTAPFMVPTGGRTRAVSRPAA